MAGDIAFLCCDTIVCLDIGEAVDTAISVTDDHKCCDRVRAMSKAANKSQLVSGTYEMVPMVKHLSREVVTR